MTACELFRARKDHKLSDEAASAAPLSSRELNVPKNLDKAEYKAQDREETARLVAQIGALQPMLYAERGRKLLLVLQGMDTSGKDGTVGALFSAINPMGVRAAAFKVPSATELAHDYLWRVHAQVPQRGEMVIFNRSHYEDVLITRVQELIDDKECVRRYAHIRDFERMLAETGTVLVKVFLHISKDEQKRRLQERLDDPDKHWKFDMSDLVQRKRWDDYQRAYERAIRETDVDHAPWYVVPADSKTQRNLAVANILLETLKGMKLRFPPGDPALSKLKFD